MKYLYKFIENWWPLECTIFLKMALQITLVWGEHQTPSKSWLQKWGWNLHQEAQWGLIPTSDLFPTGSVFFLGRSGVLSSLRFCFCFDVFSVTFALYLWSSCTTDGDLFLSHQGSLASERFLSICSCFILQDLSYQHFWKRSWNVCQS